MNELILQTLANFTVDGVTIPVAYAFYDGNADTYIVFMQEDADNAYSGDDELLGYADYYDFDVYSKNNFLKVIEELKKKLKEAGFIWIVSKTSSDLYETETKYHHKTLNFGIHRQED